MDTITWNDFSKIEMRVGTILSAEEFREARNPAYKLLVDFGEYGQRKSSAQITQRYQTSELIGRQVVGVINFPPKQIANMMSECLILGAMGTNEDVILLQPDSAVPNGLRIG